MCVENEKEERVVRCRGQETHEKVDRHSGRQTGILRASFMWEINIFVTNIFLTVGKLELTNQEHRL